MNKIINYILAIVGGVIILVFPLMAIISLWSLIFGCVVAAVIRRIWEISRSDFSRGKKFLLGLAASFIFPAVSFLTLVVAGFIFWGGDLGSRLVFSIPILICVAVVGFILSLLSISGISWPHGFLLRHQRKIFYILIILIVIFVGLSVNEHGLFGGYCYYVCLSNLPFAPIISTVPGFAYYVDVYLGRFWTDGIEVNIWPDFLPWKAWEKLAVSVGDFCDKYYGLIFALWLAVLLLLVVRKTKKEFKPDLPEVSWIPRFFYLFLISIIVVNVVFGSGILYFASTWTDSNLAHRVENDLSKLGPGDIAMDLAMVKDLKNINQHIEQYVVIHATGTPVTLAEAFGADAVPVDPVTSQPYAYESNEDHSYIVRVPFSDGFMTAYYWRNFLPESYSQKFDLNNLPGVFAPAHKWYKPYSHSVVIPTSVWLGSISADSLKRDIKQIRLMEGIVAEANSYREKNGKYPDIKQAGIDFHDGDICSSFDQAFVALYEDESSRNEWKELIGLDPIGDYIAYDSPFQLCTSLSGYREPQDEIPDQSWQTYRNEKYGLEFKYPSDDDGQAVSLADSDKGNSLDVVIGPAPSLEIFVQKNGSDSESLESWAQSRMEVLKSQFGGIKILQTTPITESESKYGSDKTLWSHIMIQRDGAEFWKLYFFQKGHDFISTFEAYDGPWTYVDRESGAGFAPSSGSGTRKIRDTMHLFGYN